MSELFAEPAWLLAAMLAIIPLGSALWLARRKSARPGGLVSAMLRAGALAAAAVALAGPLDRRQAEHLDVMFLLDQSRSIDEQQTARALQFINGIRVQERRPLRTGLTTFGAEAAVEVLVRQSVMPVASTQTQIDRDYTDIERGLEVALGGFPAGGQRKLVLLSDGRQNLGDAHAAAAAAASLGVELLAIPLESRVARDDVHAQSLTAPARVRRGEPFKIDFLMGATRAAPVNVVILRNGEVLRNEAVRLEPGPNRMTLVERADRPGLYEYEAVINHPTDGIPENNRFQTFVRIQGPPRVLYASGAPSGAEVVTALPAAAAALEAQGFSVDRVAGNAMPGDLHELVDYDLVVLDNVSGFDLSLAKMNVLDEYVRTTGGGLINLGGDRSYSAGGYQDTPLERLLPVAMDIRTEIKIPTVAVVIVIDKSGSMHSEEKLEIAKSAALSAIDLLNPTDRAGVLTFDANHQWTVPVTEAGNRRAIVDGLRPLLPGGSTNLYPTLVEAHRVMREVEAKVKHLIVLSDGLTDSGDDFAGLTEKVAQDQITLSTVALGRDADQELMRAIAGVGGGRYYYTDDPLNVPRIFTSETLIVSRDLMVDELTRPQVATSNEVLEGFSESGFPSLLGYQRAFAKPRAEVSLATAGNEPLLASWRYGLGRSVAFMSDLSGRWGRDWATWEQFSPFIAQLARWTIRKRGDERFDVAFRWGGRQGERRGELVVDVLDSRDRFVNGLQVTATVSGPGRSDQAVTLEQTAPGRYRGGFDAQGTGRYYTTIRAAGSDTTLGPRTFGAAIPYSPEFLDQAADRDLLTALAEATGGRMLDLSAEAAAEVLGTDAAAASDAQRNWWPFALVALVLLLLDVAARKLPLPRVPRAIAGLFGSGSGAGGKTDEPDPEFDELVAGIEATRERHLRALRERQDIDPREEEATLRARLYVSGARVGAQSKSWSAVARRIRP